MSGFRQQPQDSRKERLRNIEAELKNMAMAARVSQMMTQQMMQNMQNMSQDLGRALGLINELQYKLLAIQKVSGLDVSALGAVSDELRLKDFQEASDKEDAEQNFTVGTAVNQDSTVILTSTTENLDKGIFRSKIKLAECGVPDLIKGLMDREVGAKVIVQLNGAEHTVELLGIRQPPIAEAPALAPAEIQV
jgi:hypothetical protein